MINFKRIGYLTIIGVCIFLLMLVLKHFQPDFNLLVFFITELIIYFVVLFLEVSKKMLNEKDIFGSPDESIDRIRISYAGLIRIKHNGEYLLVRSDLKRKFQPIGGVYHFLNDEIKLQLDFDRDSSKGDDEDIRGSIPYKNLGKFYRWMKKKKDREVIPTREFEEELVDTGILSKENFSKVNLKYDCTKIDKIHWSPHNKIYEIIFLEIFNLIPTEEQKLEITNLYSTKSDYYNFFKRDYILSQGVTHKQSIASITDHSRYICKIDK